MPSLHTLPCQFRIPLYLVGPLLGSFSPPPLSSLSRTMFLLLHLVTHSFLCLQIHSGLPLLTNVFPQSCLHFQHLSFPFFFSYSYSFQEEYSLDIFSISFNYSFLHIIRFLTHHSTETVTVTSSAVFSHSLNLTSWQHVTWDRFPPF